MTKKLHYIEWSSSNDDRCSHMKLYHLTDEEAEKARETLDKVAKAGAIEDWQMYEVQGMTELMGLMVGLIDLSLIDLLPEEPGQLGEL